MMLAGEVLLGSMGVLVSRLTIKAVIKFSPPALSDGRQELGTFPPIGVRNQTRKPMAKTVKKAKTAKKKTGKKATTRKYSKSAGTEVKKEMRRAKKGTAKSGPGGKGGKVKSKKQAIAIGLSKARKKGAKVPKKKN
jgi:hypothetical protein